MHLVDSLRSCELLEDELSGSKRLYIDTEFESNREGKTLCLIQVSNGGEAFLVDPMRLEKLGAVAQIFSDAEEWVLHAGLQDIELLVRDLDLDGPPDVFDTQIAWGLNSAEASVSLTYLQYQLLGIRAGKSHQADDWTRRPLPDAQLRYAADDIVHLPKLREKLGKLSRDRGRESLIIDAAQDLLWPEPEPPARLTLGSFRNAWQLERDNQAALRFLIGWFNDLDSEDRRYAPPPKALLSIASRLPESGRDMGRIKGVPGRWASRFGNAVCRDLQVAVRRADDDDFVPIDPPPYATFEDIRTDAWLGAVRAGVTSELQVAPELLMPGRKLKRFRDAYLDDGLDAAIDALGEWRAELSRDSFHRWSTRIPKLDRPDAD